jgi:uncharacterized protein
MNTQIIFLNEKKYENATLITGLPGIGLVGKIAVDYMLKQLPAKKIAEVYSDSFPPSVYTKKGIIELIKDEIFHANVNGKNFLFLAGPIQPSLDLKSSSAPEHYEFASQIIEKLKEKGIKQVIALAGINIGEKRMHLTPGVIAAATDTKTLEEWKTAGALHTKTDGLISGAAGLLAGIAKQKKLTGACLMGQTNIRLVYGDPGAAKSVLEILSKKLNIPMDMSKIEKESKEIEEAFRELSKQLQNAKEEEPENGLTYVR